METANSHKWKTIQRSIEYGCAGLCALLTIPNDLPMLPGALFFGWLFGVGISFFVTGSIVSFQDWRLRRNIRSDAQGGVVGYLDRRRITRGDRTLAVPDLQRPLDHR